MTFARENLVRWTRSLRSSSYVSVVVTALSVTITIAFWATLPERYATDESTDYKRFYKPVAQNIANGHGVVIDGEPATKFPPGYPLVLVGIFEICEWIGVREETGVAALNLIGMALVSLMLFWLGRLIFGQVAALLGVGIWVTYPFALWLTKQPNSEIPFMVFLYGGLLLLCYLIFRRTRWWLGYSICGIVIGLAMLIRPIAIAIGLVFGILILILARNLRPRLRVLAISFLLSGTVIPVLPWEAWVYSRTGSFIPLSTSGPTNIKEGLTFAVNGTPYRVAGGVPTDVEAAMNDMFQRSNEMFSLRGIAGVFWPELRTRPVAVSKLYMLKIARSWYGTDSRQYENSILVVQLFYLGLVAWAVTTMWTRGTRYRRPMMVIVLVVAYFWAMNVLVNSTLRYMLPAAGLMMPLIGAALTSRRVSEETNLVSDKRRNSDNFCRLKDNPLVSVLMPVRNEAAFIGRSLGAVLAQDYPPDRMEVIVADGRSTDGTGNTVTEIARQHPNVFLLDNPQEIVATGLNLALSVAKGEIIVRVDGHTIVNTNYVRECVRALQESGGDNVGGRMTAVSEQSFGRAVAAATSSRFGVGGARFHYSEQEEWVDTVYLGAWNREVFNRVGNFDEEMGRNQDDEFNYRLRAAGGRILLDPRIQSSYFNRATARSLWKQYFQYGYWKVRVLQKHPRQMQPRQFVPAFFVLALTLLIITALLVSVGKFILLAIVTAYVIGNLFASTVAAPKAGWQLLPLVSFTFVVIHFAYGCGFLVGFVRFWKGWKFSGRANALEDSRDAARVL